jgi:hypothetical protein
MRRRYGIVLVVLVLIGALVYLHDPSWIASQTTGMWDREQAVDGSWNFLAKTPAWVIVNASVSL